MQSMGKMNYTITRQMQVDLIAAYKRVVERGCYSQTDAYERMVLEPAPRYYVSAKHAFQMLSPMMRGDFTRINQLSALKREMYYSLYREVLRMVDMPTYIGKPLWFVTQFAVQRPAPRFFISPKRAKILRNMIKSGVVDETGKVIDERWPNYVRSREKRRRFAERKKKWMQEKMSGQTDS